ncbi:unnamed protein product [Prorocentrum cordatum]|uniref:Aldose 1-epimerase n=1 Tax=Prorocentrum cordatum TaxID=2364126 RepID=A0ABN9QGK9_9DINO|nr:unnamed protein product [Polarella glacialis]
MAGRLALPAAGLLAALRCGRAGGSGASGPRAGEALVEASALECSEVDWKGLPAVELSDRGGQDFARVLPSIGGTVGSLTLAGAEVLLPLGSAEEALENHIRYHKSGMLLPWANRVAGGRYSYFGKELALDINDAAHDAAIHGLLEGHGMQVASCSGSSASLVYTFTGEEAPNGGYPFPGLSVRLDYKLEGGKFVLSVHASVPLQAQGPVPFNFGWHSYFKVSDVSQTRLEFDRRGGRQWRQLVTDANLIPTGPTELFEGFNGSDVIGGTPSRPTYWDNGFVSVDPSADTSPKDLEVRVRGPGNAPAAVIGGDAGVFRFVQVFSGSEKVFNESAVAVELMTCATNAYNTGDCSAASMYIQPGGSWAAEINVALEASQDEL